MVRRAHTSRSHIDLAWIGLGISDQLRNGLRWKRRIYLHHKWSADDAGNGRNVADKIVIEFFIEASVDCARRIDDEKRITIPWRTRDHLGGENGVSARPVLDDKP